MDDLSETRISAGRGGSSASGLNATAGCSMPTPTRRVFRISAPGVVPSPLVILERRQRRAAEIFERGPGACIDSGHGIDRLVEWRSVSIPAASRCSKARHRAAAADWQSTEIVRGKLFCRSVDRLSARACCTCSCYRLYDVPGIACRAFELRTFPGAARAAPFLCASSELIPSSD